MSRPKKYTDEYYEDAAQAMYNHMRSGRGYSKPELLQAAGFAADGKRHWSALLQAAGRIRCPIIYTSPSGWMRGTGPEVFEQHNGYIQRDVRASRSKVIGFIQEAQDAEAAVAYLLDRAKDPFSFPITLAGYGCPLPREVSNQLLLAAGSEAERADGELRDRLLAVVDEVKYIAGLLPGAELA